MFAISEQRHIWPRVTVGVAAVSIEVLPNNEIKVPIKRCEDSPILGYWAQWKKCLTTKNKPSSWVTPTVLCMGSSQTNLSLDFSFATFWWYNLVQAGHFISISCGSLIFELGTVIPNFRFIGGFNKMTYKTAPMLDLHHMVTIIIYYCYF